MCLSASEGSAFCGSNHCDTELADEYDSVWQLIRKDEKDDVIYHDDCRDGLADHLGFDSWTAAVEAAKRGDFK